MERVVFFLVILTLLSTSVSALDQYRFLIHEDSPSTDVLLAIEIATEIQDLEGGSVENASIENGSEPIEVGSMMLFEEFDRETDERDANIAIYDGRAILWPAGDDVEAYDTALVALDTVQEHRTFDRYEASSGVLDHATVYELFYADPGSCYDSDGGVDAGDPGFVLAGGRTSSDSDVLVSYADRCAPEEGFMVEVYCAEGREYSDVKTVYMECSGSCAEASCANAVVANEEWPYRLLVPDDSSMSDREDARTIGLMLRNLTGDPDGDIDMMSFSMFDPQTDARDVNIAIKDGTAAVIVASFPEQYHLSTYAIDSYGLNRYPVMISVLDVAPVDAVFFADPDGGCYDSDDGLDTETAGYVLTSGTSRVMSGTLRSYEDYCVPLGVQEHYCGSDTGSYSRIESQPIGCSTGTCVDGACVEEEPEPIPVPTCSSLACLEGTLARGSSDADHRIIVFGDVGVPSYRDWYEDTFPSVEDAYLASAEEDAVEMVFVQRPTGSGPEGWMAANAIICAERHAESGWGMHDELVDLFDRGDAAPSEIAELASQLGSTVETCVEDAWFDPHYMLEEHLDYAASEGVGGVPAFRFIADSGRRSEILGAVSFEAFEQELRSVFDLSSDAETDVEPDTGSSETSGLCTEGSTLTAGCSDGSTITIARCIGGSYERTDQRCPIGTQQSEGSNASEPAEEVCDGCMFNGTCFAKGERRSDATAYCGSGGAFEETRPTGSSCTNDHECTAGSCVSGRCADPDAQREPRSGVFGRILDFLARIFGYG